jgi:hypothetical protein
MMVSNRSDCFTQGNMMTSSVLGSRSGMLLELRCALLSHHMQRQGVLKWTIRTAETVSAIRHLAKPPVGQVKHPRLVVCFNWRQEPLR